MGTLGAKTSQCMAPPSSGSQGTCPTCHTLGTPLNSSAHQFHQNQQNQQPPLILSQLSEHKKGHDAGIPGHCSLGTNITCGGVYGV